MKQGNGSRSRRPRRVRERAVALLCLLLAACASARTYVAPEQVATGEPPPASALAYEVLLVGNLGAGEASEAEPVLRLMRAKLQAMSEASALVMLGDVLPGGLPDSGRVARPQAEARLAPLVQVLSDYAGRVVFVPGDQDLGRTAGDRLEALRRLEHYLEAALGRGNVFLPDDGFPGPAVVELTERVTLLALNTAWWMTPDERALGETDGYEVEHETDFLIELDEQLRRHDEDLVVVGHHPLRAAGPRAGNYPVRIHLFPLTDWQPWAYVPLPIVGSAYPLYRRFIGRRQDLAHGRYNTFIQALERLFSSKERFIYAAAHDEGLQYFPGPNRSQHYLISGSGGQDGFVARGRGAVFTSGRQGVLTLRYYTDGQAWLTAWAADDTPEARLLFQRQLLGPAADAVDSEVPPEAALPDYGDSTVVAAVNPAYAAGPVQRFFFGSDYRDAWTTPVAVPVLALGREQGGLTPIKRGGGEQTISLRLQSRDGHEYVLRSIDKDPSKTVPVEFRGTAATDVVQDQIASLQPYGAFVIPRLAEAAGVYHTNPKLVYVPDDPRLGIYRADFAGRIMMLEERPDDDMSDVPGFGGSREVVSATKLYREIDDDNDHRVDAEAFARARLFDMLLSDWDRHRDQWRWASFEPYELDPSLEGDARTEGKVYRPIPRDRDFAFFRFDGVIGALGPYVLPKFQDFTESYGYLPGLTLNGLKQDRRFIAPLEQEAWIAIADQMRAMLTDDVIEAAVRHLPPPVYERYGAEMARLLKVRRDQLPEVAARYYRLMARVVDVVGSNKHERFEVQRFDDRTEVVVYKTTKEGEVRKPIFRRTFRAGETEEVRLYGLGGQDRFFVTGHARGGPRLRVIGGRGEDTFVDESQGTPVYYYDTQDGNTWQAGPATRLRVSERPDVNVYDPGAYRHDFNQPLAFFGYNQDDGVFIGGGVNFVRHGFRKLPYAASHRLKANVAARTQAFNVVYDGYYGSVRGRWDAGLEAYWLAPGNIRNFYGLGNETENTEADARFYQARLTQAGVRPRLVRLLGGGAAFRAGPFFEVTNVREDPDRFIGRVQEGVSPNTFEDQWFAGLHLGLDLSSLDQAVNPKQGFRWINTAAVSLGVRNATEDFARLQSELSIFLSPLLAPQVTLALRTGGAHNVGAFPFYSASTLGGRSTLRGFRSTRFAGRTSLYQNAELRVKLTSFSAYLALGELGLLGFVDNGRVWTDGETSRAWHQGYGGGLWANLFDLFVVSSTIGVSVEETAFTFGLGFFY